MRQTCFITGTDTGAGKTVLTALLARFLRERGASCVALKPVCSGGRDDARKLRAAMNGALTLDEINPWHFRAPLTPRLAARREKRAVQLSQVLAHVRAQQKKFCVVLIEGAGGLLSPLGEDFNSRDLIIGLRAAPIVVAQNKLGAVNHLLLTLEALPNNLRTETQIVLMAPPKLDAASGSNGKLLAQFFPVRKIFALPWLGEPFEISAALKNPAVKRMLHALTRI